MVLLYHAIPNGTSFGRGRTDVIKELGFCESRRAVGKAPTKFKNIKLKIYKFSFETSIIILVQKIK